MKNDKLPTVFTNLEIGKTLRRLWLIENQILLSNKSEEEKSDFVFVMPNNGLAEVNFMKLSEFEMFENDIKPISDYVTKMKCPDKIVVIFMNSNGGFWFYTIWANTIY